MSDPIKIIQITDCHVSAAPDAVYRGIDPRETLRSLLPVVSAWGPDLVLLTGDLAEDGSEEAYAFLSAEIGDLGAPLLTIPGNHDAPGLQAQSFARTALDEPLVWDGGGWRLVCLNSAVEGRIGGALNGAMRDGLDAALASGEAPTLVVLHHQPVPVGSPWIDRYALDEPQYFWEVIDRHPQVRAVCWGHIHHDFHARRGAITLLGAPSTACNSLPEQERFVADEAGPACRWLELDADGRLETGLLRPGAGSAKG